MTQWGVGVVVVVVGVYSVIGDYLTTEYNVSGGAQEEQVMII